MKNKGILSALVAILMIISITVPLVATQSIPSEIQGFDITYLEALSDDELLLLYSPFQAIVDDLNERYGTEMLPPLMDDIDVRAAVIHTIAHVSQDEFIYSTIIFKNQLLELRAWNSFVEMIVSSDDVTADEKMNHAGGYVGFERLMQSLLIPPGRTNCGGSFTHSTTEWPPASRWWSGNRETVRIRHTGVHFSGIHRANVQFYITLTAFV